MRTVIFSTSTKIPCSCQQGAEVILCLVLDTLLASGKQTLAGTLLNAIHVCEDACDDNPHWHYNIEYDESLLEDPNTPLTSDDITGIFCANDCFFKYIQDNVFEGVALQVSDTSSIDLSIGGTLPQTLTADIKSEGITENMLAPTAASRSCELFSGLLEDVAEGAFAATAMFWNPLSLNQAKKFPKACIATDMSVGSDNLLSSGNYRVSVYKNGVSAATFDVNEGREAGPLSLSVSFAAGDEISLWVTGISQNWAGGTTSNILAEVIGAYTE